MSQSTDNESLSSYHSGLDQAPARFLSRVVQHTLANDWQTPDDFLQHFGPDAIVQSLAKADALRAKLLVKLANVHERIAVKKSIDSASEDLRLALEEGITTAQAVVEQYPADDRVRYLKAPLLWNFMFAEPFHKTTHSDGEAAYARAAGRMIFLLQCALDEGVLTLEQFADGLGFEFIVEHLPVDLLRKVVVSALRGGRRKEPLSEAALFEVVALPQVLKFLPLDIVWQRVVIDRIAKSNGWVEGEAVTTSESSNPAVAPRVTPPKKRPSEVPPPAPTAAPPPPASSERSSERTPEPSAASAAEPVEVRVADDGAAAQDEARTRAMQRLKDIERLPPRHEELSTPILLSIESMYDDLLQAGTDDERSECIRESFPNEAHLRTAMFALAELLEPSIDVTRPPICDADTDALVKLVVFEERKRKDGDGGMRRASVRPPPLPMGRSASSIPAARKNER
jgi:hypothetical protein